jgi:hypothetical protein
MEGSNGNSPPSGITITAILPDEGTGMEPVQRRRVAETIVRMLQSRGFVCRITYPDEPAADAERPAR